jgi:septum formation protein
MRPGPRRLILGSGSPRRRELLDLLGLPFEVATSSVVEVPRNDETPEDFVSRTAREKGLDVASRYDDAVVLAADTIVVVDDQILGKPSDRSEAVGMLGKLSGREHAVLTGVVTVDSRSGRIEHGIDRTRVWFGNLRQSEIDTYLRREHVLDKAGAYAIQGLASAFIPRIEGNYPNVVGLPMPLVVELLERHGIAWAASATRDTTGGRTDEVWPPTSRSDS